MRLFLSVFFMLLMLSLVDSLLFLCCSNMQLKYGRRSGAGESVQLTWSNWFKVNFVPVFHFILFIFSITLSLDSVRASSLIFYCCHSFIVHFLLRTAKCNIRAHGIVSVGHLEKRKTQHTITTCTPSTLPLNMALPPDILSIILICADIVLNVKSHEI